MINGTRKGNKDVWNACLCEGAIFSIMDITHCPTTADDLPQKMILWDEAKSIYKKHCCKNEKDFFYNAYVCFYMDDYKFDGSKGVWFNYSHTLKVLKHFAGVITVDFSTFQDFPEPIKIYNTYRMRTLGYWWGKNGLKVINNVRWGTKETWHYCWAGIPHNSIVAIGTVGGNPKRLKDRKRFNEGFEEMLRVLRPTTIIVYGSANYEVFEIAKSKGVKVIAFPSRTYTVFAGGRQ